MMNQQQRQMMPHQLTSPAYHVPPMHSSNGPATKKTRKDSADSFPMGPPNGMMPPHMGGRQPPMYPGMGPAPAPPRNMPSQSMMNGSGPHPSMGQGVQVSHNVANGQPNHMGGPANGMGGPMSGGSYSNGPMDAKAPFMQMQGQQMQHMNNAQMMEPRGPSSSHNFAPNGIGGGPDTQMSSPRMQQMPSSMVQHPSQGGPQQSPGMFMAVPRGNPPSQQPSQQQQQQPQFCPACARPIQMHEVAVTCDGNNSCRRRFHGDCIGMSPEAVQLIDSNAAAKWVCQQCCSPLPAMP